jgi:excisionase family DNA binding protein
MKIKGYLSTAEAAARLGLKDKSRVRQLILAGRVQAEKVGRDWLIESAELDRFIKGDRDRRRKAEK